jgi:hypothetical protein
MLIHLSVHDVSPAWAPEIEMAVSLARRHGTNPSLLVVPDFHGRWPLLEHAAFCRRLKQLSREGCETHLHGFFHSSRTMAPGPSPLSPWQRLRRHAAQRWVSDGEAEFSDVTKAEASLRLEHGEDIFARADLPVDGFVPPAWSMPAWLVPMLAKRRYRFTEDHTTIYDPLGQASRRSLVLNYATRTPMRLVSTLAYCRAAALAAKLVPTRLAIHPADLRFAVVRNELDRLLERFRGGIVARSNDLFDG